MPGQPPPELPPIPVSEQALRSRRWNNAIIWTGIISVTGLLFGLSRPMSFHCGGNAEIIEAATNGKQIALALLEFEKEYGSLPSITTIPRVVPDFPGDAPLLSGGSSNARFRQLLVPHITSSEMFFRAGRETAKPDNVITGRSALAKGECSFAYFPGGISTMNPPRPVAAYPVTRGKRSFGTNLPSSRTREYRPRAIVVMSDGSVRSANVQKKTGKAFLDGREFFDPAHPHWHGLPVDVCWPE